MDTSAQLLAEGQDTASKTFITIHVGCSLLSALCSLLSALCSLLSTICSPPQVLHLSIEDFLDHIIRRQLGQPVEGSSVLYSPQEELRLATSVLFKFLRKDVEDARVVGDLRGWCDKMVALLHRQVV